MTSYGYARVSTADQDTATQRDALEAAGCSIVREEVASASTRKGRPQLALLLEFVREGDELVVTRIDRLARSIRDLAQLVDELKARGASLRATEQPVDTSSASGRAFLAMLGVFAEFETNLRAERQADGIAKAKAKGRYRGRPQKYDPAELRRLRDEEGLTPVQIRRRTGAGKTTVWEALNPEKKRKKPAKAPERPAEPQQPPAQPGTLRHRIEALAGAEAP